MQKLSDLQNQLVSDTKKNKVAEARKKYLTRVGELLEKYNCSSLSDLDDAKRVEFLGEMLKSE